MATEPTSVRVESHMSISSITFFQMIVDKNRDLLAHEGGIEGVMKNLNTDPEKGITSNSVEQRVEVYGKNELPEEEEVTYLKYLLEALSDKMILLLLTLGILNLILGMTIPHGHDDEVDLKTGWIDGTFIIVAVTLVVLCTSINDYLKGLKFQALNRLTSQVPFKVRRDGQIVTIDVAEIVVGDIVLFQGGTFLPADGLFLKGQGVAVDESAATGENDDKKKDTVKDPFILSGTNVIAGVDAEFLCIAVGEKSFSGTIEMNAREKGRTTATPLQEKLDDLAELVGRVGITIAVILFITLALISIIKARINNERYDFRHLLDYAILGVSIIVAAVPEGLPLSVVIALAYSMQAMMRDNNMVRSLAACETMGAATSICSDKTGTLTTNEMTQIKACIGGLVTKDYDHNGTANLSLTDLHDQMSEKLRDMYLDAIFFNSTATKIEAVAGTKQKITADGMIWSGNKTEQGLLRWAERAAGKSVVEYRKTPKGDMFVYPFRSDKKSMTVLMRKKDPYLGEKVIQYSKGATEVIFAHCKSYLDKDGNEQPMTAEFLEEANKTLKEFASQGLRTLGVTYRVFGDYDTPFPEEDPFDNNLILIGFSAIQDPVRDEVPGAVASCQQAGVTVRMCTGDNLDTAKAISKQCGIYTEGGVAMEGPDFRRLFCEDEPKFMEMLPKLQVLARCSPLDKQLFVGNLMLLGEVVAVTGDGTNDAPALKLADVGFAMNDGTDVAKKASKIVLLDNNFVSVVQACKWGRNVNDSIRKFLQFQLTVNVVLLTTTIIGVIKDAVSPGGKGEPPLAPIHLLWCNIIMDTMAAMALSTEAPNKWLLTRPPTYRDSPLISNKMRRFILGSAVIQLAVLLTLVFHGTVLFETVFDFDYHNGTAPFDPTPEEEWEHIEENAIRGRTVIFNCLIFMAVFNWFHARKLYDEWNFLEGFSRSPFFLPIVAVTAGIQVFIVEVAGTFMKTTTTGSTRWGVSVAISTVVLPWGMLLRFIPVEESEHVTKRLDEEVEKEREKKRLEREKKKKKKENGAEEEEEEEESSEDEGDYSANKKLRMVLDVRKQQRELFKSSPTFKKKEEPFERVRRPWEHALHNIHRKITIIRAFRGPRGSTMPRARTSGLSAQVRSNISSLAARSERGSTLSKKGSTLSKH